MAGNAELMILIKAKDQASAVMKGVNKNAQGLSKSLQSVGIVGATAAVAGVGAVGLALKGAVEEAAEAQRVMAQTAAVIKSTGGAAGLSAPEVANMAAELSRVAPFGDEAIQSMQNVLLTFTKIGKGAFPQATEAVLDMSTALGQDLQSSAIQIGKALNDPVKGITALQRVGVAFTKQQKEQINALAESGDLLGAQKLILQELQVEFGGSARAAGDTFAGKMKILGTQIGNVKETIGNALLPTLTIAATALSNFLAEHQASIERFGQVAGAWLGRNVPIAFAAIVDAVQTVRPAVEQFARAFISGIQTIAPVVRDLFEFLINNKPVLIAAIAAIGVAIVAALGPGAAAVLAIVGLIALVGLIRDNWEEIRVWVAKNIPFISFVFDKHFNEVKAVVMTVVRFVTIYVRDQLTFMRDAFQLFAALVRGDWEEVWENLKQIVTGRLQTIKEVITLGLSILAGLFGGLGQAIAEAVGDLGRTLFNAGRDLIQGFIDGVRSVPGVGFIADLAGGALGALIGSSGSQFVGAHQLFLNAAAASAGRHQRQHGGPVWPGGAFLVGERGPEMFVPRTSGQIVPNGGAGGLNVHVNVFAEHSRAGIISAVVRELERELDRASIGASPATAGGSLPL
jgi:hypothetical protein